VRGILIFIALGLFQLSFGQTRVFKAQFKSVTNGEKIIYAKVTNVGGGSRLTNIDGYVEIAFEVGDRIRVSHLTFDTLLIRPGDYTHLDTAVFYLSPRIYTIDEFKFTVLGPRVFFDNKFVSNDLGKSDEEKVKEKLKIIEMKMDLIALDRGAQGGAVLGSPITHLYERYSKAGKERQKYHELIMQQRRDSVSGRKFDDVVVKTLTSYDDKEMQRFLEFCSFHQSYINSVDALELYYEIIRCKDEYEEKEF
jgi:hypothetical protein